MLARRAQAKTTARVRLNRSPGLHGLSNSSGRSASWPRPGRKKARDGSEGRGRAPPSSHLPSAAADAVSQHRSRNGRASIHVPRFRHSFPETVDAKLTAVASSPTCRPARADGPRPGVAAASQYRCGRGCVQAMRGRAKALHARPGDLSGQDSPRFGSLARSLRRKRKPQRGEISPSPFSRRIRTRGPASRLG